MNCFCLLVSDILVSLFTCYNLHSLINTIDILRTAGTNFHKNLMKFLPIERQIQIVNSVPKQSISVKQCVKIFIICI
jgi:hypothetical protein